MPHPGSSREGLPYLSLYNPVTNRSTTSILKNHNLSALTLSNQSWSANTPGQNGSIVPFVNILSQVIAHSHKGLPAALPWNLDLEHAKRRVQQGGLHNMHPISSKWMKGRIIWRNIKSPPLVDLPDRSELLLNTWGWCLRSRAHHAQVPQPRQASM